MGAYPTAAKDRETKIFRAIESVFAQTCQDYELIIVADGCTVTRELIQSKLDDPAYEKVKGFYIEKEPLFSGKPRNAGIHKAEGDWIVYLDIDDYLAPGHLQFLSDAIDKKNNDWVWFDHWQFGKPQPRAQSEFDWLHNNKWYSPVNGKTNIEKRFHHGTCNVAHKRSLEVYWKDTGYMHDFHFINELKKASTNYSFIGQSGYYICHLPNHYDI